MSRISPKAYLWIFIPCDFISLTLQGAGGGISSVSSQQNKSTASGEAVILSGLIFQVVTLALFMVLCAEFAFRYRQAQREPVDGGSRSSARFTRRFKLFLVCLGLATLLIFVRCFYRVFELAEGWRGKLVRDQPLYIALEGV